MHENHPLISVIIPVYNVEKYLPECLDKTLGQSLHNIEIICIDDCSTDNSLKILKEYSAKDPRMKVLEMNKNSGSGPVRNLGIQRATGEFLAFMDPDDYYYNEHCLELLYNNATANDVDLCGGNIRYLWDGSGELLPTGNIVFETCELINTYDIQNPYEYQRYIFRKDIIMKRGIRFPAYRRFQDPVFMLKCMVAIDKLFVTNKIIYIYRQNHKTVAWNIEKCTDMLKGVSDILRISKENNLWIGYKKAVEFFLKIRLFVSFNLLSNKNISKMMRNIASSLLINKMPNEYQQEINTLLKHPTFYFFQPRLTRLFRTVLYVKNSVFKFFKGKDGNN